MTTNKYLYRATAQDEFSERDFIFFVRHVRKSLHERQTYFLRSLFFSFDDNDVMPLLLKSLIYTVGKDDEIRQKEEKED